MSITLINCFQLCRNEEDSDEDVRSPRSDENQSFSNPTRDDSDTKTKISEMNEEKRTKLREIEVLHNLCKPPYN